MTREEALAALGAFAIMAGMRLLDYLTPKGWHFRWLSRYAERDALDKQEEEC